MVPSQNRLRCICCLCGPWSVSTRCVPELYTCAAVSSAEVSISPLVLSPKVSSSLLVFSLKVFFYHKDITCLWVEWVVVVVVVVVVVCVCVCALLACDCPSSPSSVAVETSRVLVFTGTHWWGGFHPHPPSFGFGFTTLLFS